MKKRISKINRRALIIAGLVLISRTVCSEIEAKAEEKPQKLSLTSSVISNGAVIQKKYTEDGADVSPPLSWSAGPAGTKSYAISVEDPDAPTGTWWHWILINIPPNTRQLGENVPKSPVLAGGTLQCSNDFGKTGYNGPAPPPGKIHHYQFKVKALDTMLALKQNCDKSAFQRAVKGHVLAEGMLTGCYSR